MSKGSHLTVRGIEKLLSVTVAGIDWRLLAGGAVEGAWKGLECTVAAEAKNVQFNHMD